MFITIRLILLAFLFCASLFSTTAFCKNIDLYDQPQANAKVVGTIDLAAGIIPIFTPKDNTTWIKVADPRNGNVGWVKNSDLSGNGATSFSFKQQINSGNNPPQSYQIIVGDPKNLPVKEPSADMMQMIKNQQQKLLNAAQQMINDVNQMNQRQGTTAVPMLMPVVVVPEEKPAPQK